MAKVAETATRARVNSDLLAVDWEEVFNAMSVCDQWQAFLDRFLPVVDEHAPLKNLTIQISPPLLYLSPRVTSYPSASMIRATAVRPRVSGLQGAEPSRSSRHVSRPSRELEKDISERGVSQVWRCIRSVIAGKKDGLNVQPDLSADDLHKLIFLSVCPRIATEIRDQNTATDLKVRLPPCRCM